MSNGEGNGAFESKHHGKTQSHVVSLLPHTSDKSLLAPAIAYCYRISGPLSCLLPLIAFLESLRPALH